jgi:hypothetical protein
MPLQPILQHGEHSRCDGPAQNGAIPDDWLCIGSRAARARSKVGTILDSQGNRNATHPVNAMINYAYGLLECRMRIAIRAVGLDPDIGFMHEPKTEKGAQRSPLVLDLMEPLRPIVDRAVLGFVWARKAFHPEDFFITKDGICRLHPQLARVLVGKVDELLGDQPIQLARHVATWIGHQILELRDHRSSAERPASKATRHAGSREGTLRRKKALRSKPNPRELGVLSVAEWRRRPGWSRARDTEMKRWYEAELLPSLKYVQPTYIRQSTGVGPTYSTQVKHGRKIPHPRIYRTLAGLAKVQYPFDR